VFDNQGEENVFGVTNALEALSELAENTSDAIVRQRVSERVQIRAKVTIRPGNSSRRHEYAIDGLTGDISNGGCQVLIGCPILPGDVYWLSVTDKNLALGSLLARCMRCRMVREDTFEAGFRFFNEIDLAGAIQQQNDHEW
jgi:hypothetical protein